MMGNWRHAIRQMEGVCGFGCLLLLRCSEMETDLEAARRAASGGRLLRSACAGCFQCVWASMEEAADAKRQEDGSLLLA